MIKDDFYTLPSDLPVPIDDGRCRHLSGMQVPAIALASTSGRRVGLAEIAKELAVIYCYPRTGVPGRPVVKVGIRSLAPGDARLRVAGSAIITMNCVR